MGRPTAFDPEHAITQAMELFWRQGYGATSPQQLADHLHIGKGSLYNTFGGKRQLFDLALRRYLDLRVEGLTHWQDQQGPAKARLREALLSFIGADPENPDRRGCLATNTAVEFGPVDEAVAREVRGLFDRAEHVFQVLVEQGQREGDIRRDIDARVAASMLLSAVTGLHVLARLAFDAERLEQAVDGTLALL
jgi:TetR/AcrR family transcriptional repressor of nem operon